MTATEVLDDLRAATAALHKAADAAINFARASVKETEAKLADDDEWTRLPKSPARCHVSGWGRTTLIRKATDSRTRVAGKVRMKHVGATRFYSAADVRKILNATPA
jgi:hypothetical protein